MEPWSEWRKRAKEWKKDNQLDDDELAAAVGRKRATINSWLNKREPNLSDFMALCEAMGADPGLILFGRAIFPSAVSTGSEAHRAMTSAPTANPNHHKLMQKFRKFKANKVKLRRGITRS